MELRDLRAPASSVHQCNSNCDCNCNNCNHGGGTAGVGVGAGELGDICIGSASVQRMPTRADLLMEQLNASNAKKVALLLVIGFVLYHGLLNWNYGSDSCQWLLSKGRFKGDNEWQPYGCMMHKYSYTDTRRCLRYLAFFGNKNNFVFIGDRSVRLLYQRFIEQLHLPQSETDPVTNERQSEQTGDTDHDTNGSSRMQSSAAGAGVARFEDKKLQMLAQYIRAEEVSPALIDHMYQLEQEKQLSSFYVLGFTYGTLLAGNVTDEVLRQYRFNLTLLVAPIHRLVAQTSRVLWKLTERVDEEKLPPAWKLLLNDDIDRLNNVARNVFRYTDATIWESADHIANGLVDNALDGHRLSAHGQRLQVQLLWNMYCNDQMNYNDGTCCSSAEPHTSLQIVAYALFGVCITLVCGMCLRRWMLHLRGQTLYVPLQQQPPPPPTNSGSSHPHQQSSQQHQHQSTHHYQNQHQHHHALAVLITDYGTPLVALSLLGVIMGYFYLCDRTNFFMKENKYYSEFSFWIPVGYVFALGLFFTEDSRFTKVLNQDQTDELRGWILLVVLIYYMTGAQRILPIHMHIKLLISGYFFLTGYTHFTHVWQTGGSGSMFVRFFQAMFRVNFLSVLLCFCMNRPYQFYYFVPLLSFWLCIVYFVLSLPPRITAASVEANPLHYLYLVCKCIGCLGVITVLFMSEVFFERIFVTRPWKALFVTTDDDIHEWWYQWKLDRYTVTFGMIYAACFHIAHKYNVFDDNNHGNLFSRRTSISVTLLALLGVGIYTSFSFLCRNVQNCEEIHSYIVFIPIIGYIVLRNISGILRTRYSSFFAWFGRISLELFVCQYHIWLAADRHGVLVLLPGFPTLNMIITSFIFVCASHEVHRLTQILLPYAVPNDWRLVMRNLVIFLIVLIPVARSDGMF
ncbi:N-acetylneuraminate 9-O-acetyltransferase [Drosophila grimshawi]|uniref:GH17907 n=1 Tax=Drosophila grimshawi TaxID=7222 RepID=B4JX92_DROGR|nr:N-acetylneuraminate 9-O-acetyltransferase [Drosophila grimshawi]EDV95368.1 GH17907 [Drosophila grimshawi]